VTVAILINRARNFEQMARVRGISREMIVHAECRSALAWCALKRLVRAQQEHGQ
jgi:hypothetical protein